MNDCPPCRVLRHDRCLGEKWQCGCEAKIHVAAEAHDESAEADALRELLALWHKEFHQAEAIPRLLPIPTAREELQAWIVTERATYADIKFSDENRAFLIKAMREEKLGPIWMGFIGNYLKRAELFGLDTLQGRQALGKTIVTLLHCLETAIDEFGPMPAPGVSSGEIS